MTSSGTLRTGKDNAVRIAVINVSYLGLLTLFAAVGGFLINILMMKFFSSVAS